jgi:lysophospholipase L1-like esterase
MKFFLGGLVVVALGCFYFWHPIRQAVKISNGIIATTEPYEQSPQNAQKRILVAGDSTAYGTGAAENTQSVAGRVGALFPEATLTNVSVNGLRLAGLRELLNEQPETSYDLILLQIGANDVTGFTGREAVRSDLEKVLEYAEAHAPHVVVVTSGNVGLSPLFKSPVAELLGWRTRVVREIFIDTIAKRPAVAYVDLYVEREDDVFLTDVPRYYAEDLFHPSGDGYGLWFADIEKVLASHVTWYEKN